MGFDWLTLEHLAAEWALVTHAPVLMLATIAASLAGGFFAARFRYETKIGHLEERIKLKDDQLADYRDKLSGASPDEAKARLDALEERVTALGPRRLSDRQRADLSAALARNIGSIYVMQDMAIADARAFTGDFIWAFQNAGWTVQNVMVMGPGNPPPSGLGLVVPDPANLTPEQTAIHDGLRLIGVSFDLQRGAPNHPHQAPRSAEILITSRIV